MKLKLVYIFLVCLAGLNLFLLYTNVQRQNEINNLRSSNSKTTAASTPILSKEATLIHPDIALKPDGLSFSIIVPQNSCSSCLEFEVPNINDLYREYPDQVQLYILGQDEQFLSPYGFTHTSQVIDPMKPVFDHEFDFVNPVAVITDSEGIIHKFYAAEVGNVEKSDRFYKRIESFFNAIY